MGYRSDVVIITDPLIPWPDEVKAELTPYNSIQERPECTCWHRDYIKFYDDYFPRTNEWLTSLNDQDHQWGFIRIGEDYEDIETKGSPYDFDVYVERKIVGV